MAAALSSTTVHKPSPAPHNSSAFTFPPYTSFPPFYTLQPNITTRARQLDLWSSLILSYTSHHRLFRLSLTNPPSDLFTSADRTRNLKTADIRTVLEYVSKPENGSRIEFIPAVKGAQSDSCYVWWRTQGEWADMLYGWVEGTGQRGSVLTLYELREGEEGEAAKEWKGMDEGMLRKVLGVLVKRSKAQMFEQADGEGVKFF